MPSIDSPSDRLERLGRIWIDALSYAIVVATVAAAAALIVGVATGGGAVRAKILLFVGGWALLSYATFRLWPTSIEDVESSADGRLGESISSAHDETRFQSLVRRLPPARWVQPPNPEDRVSPPGKLLFGSVLMLLLSFLMETALGVS